MRNPVVLAVLATSSLLASAIDIPPYHEFPIYKIDLDLAPQDRWTEAITALKPEI